MFFTRLRLKAVNFSYIDIIVLKDRYFPSCLLKIKNMWNLNLQEFDKIFIVANPKAI